MLEVESVYAEVAGERFQLQHINRLRDVPGGRSGLVAALNLMTDKKDWDNLPSILRGLKNAGLKFKAPVLLKLTRRAGI